MPACLVLSAPGRTRLLVALFGLALGLRLGFPLWTTSIAGDAQSYLRTAELFAEGRFGEGLEYGSLHPAFPFLTAWLSKALGSLEASAILLSIVVGSLAMFPLHSLVRAWWTERVALWTAFVYAVHPILIHDSSEALPTGFYLGVFVAAIAAGVRALQDGPWMLYPAAGLAAGLAYLTRTEGILAIAFLLGGAVFTLVGLVRGRVSRARWLRFAGGVLAAAALFNAVALPYIRWVTEKNGRFGITRKGGALILDKALQRGTEWAPEAAVPKPYFTSLFKEFNQALFWPFLPLLVLGLAFTRRQEGRWRSLLPLLLMSLLSIAPACLLFALNRYFRPSHRYMLVGILLLLPWVACGILVLADALARLAARRSWPAWLAYAPAFLVLAVMVVKIGRPRRPEEVVFEQAGRWILEQPMKPSRRILTAEPKIAWFGRCDPVWDTRLIDQPGAAFRETAASLIVLHARSLQTYKLTSFERLESDGFERAAVFEQSGGREGMTVWIYRPKPPP